MNTSDGYVLAMHRIPCPKSAATDNECKDSNAVRHPLRQTVYTRTTFLLTYVVNATTAIVNNSCMFALMCVECRDETFLSLTLGVVNLTSGFVLFFRSYRLQTSSCCVPSALPWLLVC